MGDDAFVAKVNAPGTALVYAGFIGGDGGDFAEEVAIDASGAAYVTGYTNSDQATFPIVDAPDPSANGGNDAFITKVVPAGTGFAYSGFLGGADEDSGESVAVDLGGAANVAGRTASDQTTFPVLVGPDTTYNGLGDGFVAKVETTERCQGKPVTRLGSDGNDSIIGTSGPDVFLAQGGNDRVNAKGGKDRVCAGPDNDKVKGGGGNDRLLGEQGRDNLNGGAGKRDLCKGGPGKDKGGKGCEKGRL
jgi:Ca2+-binding RTX toxin-like protein